MSLHLSRKMTVTVIGMGAMGKRRAAACSDMGCKVIPCDTNPTLSSFGTEYEINTAIKNSDAVIICTPPDAHFQYIIAAYRHNKRPMLVEKPFCLADDIRGAAEIVQAKNQMTATGFNLRFHPHVVRASNLAAESRPIAATFVLSQRCDRPDLDLWHEWGSHEIDLAQHLVGSINDILVSNTTAGKYGWKVIQHTEHTTSIVRVDTMGVPPVRRFELLLNNGRTVSADLENPRASEEDYRNETWAFLRSVDDGEIEAPLATGADGLRVAELCI
jgi:predicted dehydrogenase